MYRTGAENASAPATLKSIIYNDGHKKGTAEKTSLSGLFFLSALQRNTLCHVPTNFEKEGRCQKTEETHTALSGVLNIAEVV